MEAKIIKRSVAPNRFVIYENDAGCSFLFRVDKINDGISVEELDGYLQIESESGFTDKIALSKSIGETEVYFTCTTSLSLTGQAGLISAQISFENAQKTIVYNTEIFYIDVKETIDGLESYQNIVPSVIESLQTEMRQKVDVCEELKNQTLAVKQEIEEIKAEVDEKHQDISQSAVLSVNGKTGNAILSAQDVGAISSSVKSLPNPEILNINGVGYDGSQAVTIDVGETFEEIVDQNAKIVIKNGKTYFVEQPTSINIIKGTFGKTAPERAVMYLNFKKDTTFTAIATDFTFSGDGTSGGDFMCEEGFYRLEFLKSPHLDKIKVFCKKCDSAIEGYEDRGSFPLTLKGKKGSTYYYGVSGNTRFNVDMELDYIDYPYYYEESIEGVNELQTSGVYGNYLRILSETANLLPLPDKTVKMGGVTGVFEKDTNLMTLNGEITSNQDYFIKLNNKISPGRKYGVKVFFKGGISKSSSTKPIFYLLVRNNGFYHLKIGVYADGRYENLGQLGAFVDPENDLTDVSIVFTEEGVGAEFVDFKLGLFVGLEGYMDEFVPHERYESLVNINKPLLSFNGKCDEVDMINNRIIRRVGLESIYYSYYFQPASAPYENNLKYMGSGGGGFIAEGKEIDTSGECPVYVLGLKKELHKDALVVNPDYIIFKSSNFPTIDSLDDYCLPYVIMYAYKNERYENLSVKKVIKYFDGITHVSVCSKVKPSASFLKTIVK